jgi:phage/plasmid-associated DNA primase
MTTTSAADVFLNSISVQRVVEDNENDMMDDIESVPLLEEHQMLSQPVVSVENMVPMFSPDFIPDVEDYVHIGQTELTIDSPDCQIVDYFRITRHIFHQSTPSISDIVHIFPTFDLEASATRVSASMAYISMRGHELYDEENPNRNNVFGMTLMIFLETIDSMHRRSTEMSNVVRMWFAVQSNAPPPKLYHHPEDNDVLQGTTMKPHQKVLEFVFQRAGDARLRRSGSDLFRPIYLEDGTNTQFYTHYMDTRQYTMEAVTPMHRYAEQYNALTLNPSSVAFVTNFLADLPDPRVPKLVVNRSLFSFKNGIYDVRSGKLHSYRDASFTDVTARFFDTDVNMSHLECDPMSIETPCFDKILKDQEFDDHTRYWLYTMCGRLFHDVGSMDDWQICPFIRGVAGSGKSTILKIMKMMYEDHNVGALMSDGQPTFSDEHLYDKFMVVAMDLDKEVQISGTRINSMISGEGLSINRKFKVALNCEWKAPLMMASNSQPPFKDVAGNIVRRFAIFLFNHSIRHSDPQLFSKLKLEVPILLIKMSRIYLDAVSKYGQRSVWEDDILPPIVHQARRQYLVTANPVSAFLESEWVQFGDGQRTSSSDLKKYMTQFTKDLGDRRLPSIGMLSKVDHGHLFAMYGCELKEEIHGQSRRVYIDGMSIRPPSG